MATPHVTGLLALLKSHNDSYDQNQLKNAILSSVDHLESLENITLTEGRINAYKALEQSPDPDDIRLWIHRPTSYAHWKEETSISISLNDRVNPILGANVSVEFSTGEDTIYLEDDGSRGDLPEDGYYTGKWTPRTLGEVELSITTKLSESQEMVKNITVTVRGDSGIALLDSEDNILNGNNISNNFYGISFFTARSNELADNLLEDNNQVGMRFYDSRDNELINQTISNSEYGLLFEQSNDNSIFNSTITNTFMGVRTKDSEHNKFSNNNLSRNFYGVILERSRENNLTENDILDNLFYGIILYQSENNKLDNNIVDNTLFYGIYILETKENLLTNNKVSYSIFGILNMNSDNNEFYRNEISKNIIGIYLGNSKNVILTENTMVDDSIFVFGDSLEHWNTHTIDTSNTVNGDPVYYWKDKTGGTVPEDAGQVILANCTGVTVGNLDLNDSTVGIELGFSDDNILKDNSIEQSLIGIVLWNSGENLLTNNMISNNQGGVYIEDSHDNLIYRNWFNENVNQAWDYGDNNWDAGDPAEDGKGGNYWSDYEGKDRGDGIGEEPYEIIGDDNQDNYPWMTEEMVRWYELTINFEGEGTVEVDGEKFEAEEEYLYKEGSEVELEAIAEEGWRFRKWTGDYQSEERVIIVTMDETKNITVLFEEKEKSIQEIIIEFIKNILKTLVDFILDIIPDLPDKLDRPDMPEIPGFSFFLLLLGLVVSVAIHHTKKR